jgi:2-methylcitrate dehydratase PrpD
MNTQTEESIQDTIAGELARRIHAFGKEQASRRALEQAATAVNDTIGVMLAGAAEESVRVLRDVPGVASASGNSLIVGTDRRTSVLDATLVNGTASHALDYDDFCGVLGGHQSVPIVPALLAVAEERKLSGLKVELAYIIGVETENRLARAVNFHHYDKGWHPTATLGIFGTTAAVSYLVDLDKTKTAVALGLAASLAAGIKANFGTMTKPLHVGQCGRQGLLAVLLAERGFTANPAALEHEQGFLNVFNGPGNFDVERIFDGWGKPLEVEDISIALKQYPCCGSTHPAIAMALALRAEENVRTDDIEAIDIMPHGRRLRHTNDPDPQTPLQAKFSVQYVVARALRDGSVKLRDFEGNAYAEASIKRLLSLTRTKAHAEMTDDGPNQWGAEVIVITKDGRRLARRVDQMIGRSSRNPMSSRERWEKFEDCAQRTLPRKQIAPLFERLETLESVADMSLIARLMAVRQSRA